MKKHLYFICPTDYLERVINNTFKEDNYYCSSLGNSVVFDSEMVTEINGLIEAKNIREITFILSDNNRIVLDALRDYDSIKVSGLNKFYNEIAREKERSKVLWQMCDLRIPILSYYLNVKINELLPRISRWMIDQVKVNSKIYNTSRAVFREVHSDLFGREFLNLN